MNDKDFFELLCVFSTLREVKWAINILVKELLKELTCTDKKCIEDKIDKVNALHEIYNMLLDRGITE